MARKFLYLVAAAILFILALMFALNIWSEDLTEMTFVPDEPFVRPPELAENSYAGMDMWIARPGMGTQDSARWLPEGARGNGASLPVAVFFIHPTSYLEKAHWNGPLDDAKSRQLAETFVQAMASPFNESADIWAPRYRQAAFGAFLTDAPAAQQALDLAYGDVLNAFDRFLATANPKTPIVLAGHSQGAYLLRRLLRERVANTPLSRRIVAVYAVGWPVSLTHDLPAMGLPACTAPDQTGCVLSWMSFADPADTGMIQKAYARHPGLDGQPMSGSPFLCTNPLTGTEGGKADAAANLGTLVPDAEMKSGKLVPGMVPARCGEDGFLHIGPPPELGRYVLPGNNYHVYDMVLFWANLRSDFERRVRAWKP